MGIQEINNYKIPRLIIINYCFRPCNLLMEAAELKFLLIFYPILAVSYLTNRIKLLTKYIFNYPRSCCFFRIIGSIGKVMPI